LFRSASYPLRDGAREKLMSFCLVMSVFDPERFLSLPEKKASWHRNSQLAPWMNVQIILCSLAEFSSGIHIQLFQGSLRTSLDSFVYIIQ
jgi:hypothetical protein